MMALPFCWKWNDHFGSHQNKLVGNVQVHDGQRLSGGNVRLEFPVPRVAIICFDRRLFLNQESEQ